MKSVTLLLVIFCVAFAVNIPISPKHIDEIPEYSAGIVFDFIVVGAGASGCLLAARYQLIIVAFISFD